MTFTAKSNENKVRRVRDFAFENLAHFVLNLKSSQRDVFPLSISLRLLLNKIYRALKLNDDNSIKIKYNILAIFAVKQTCKKKNFQTIHEKEKRDSGSIGNIRQYKFFDDTK